MNKQLISGLLAVCLGLTLFPSAAFAEEQQAPTAEGAPRSDISDIFGPTDTPAPAPEEGTGEKVEVPDISAFQTNEEFKPYDPWYPQKDQYGDYILTIPKLKGRLSLFAGEKNKLTARLYAPGVSQSEGWKDATKRWGGQDDGLCFAASSSNLISWYLNRYVGLHPENQNDYELDAEKAFDRFRNGWTPYEGGNQKEALSWYFTGGFPSGSPDPFDNHLTGREHGGYLSGKIPHNTSEQWSEVSFDWQPSEIFSVFGSFGDDRFPFMEDVGGMTGKGAFSTWESFSEQVIRQLHYGACTISIVTDRSMGGGGHAITLWGVDYEVDTGLVTAIHVTDSDDNRGLFTVKIVRGDSNSGVRMVDYPYHGQGEPQKFTRIRDSILLYSPEVVRSSKEEPELPESITSNKYPIDENRIITGIQPGETLTSIRQDLIGQNIKVFDAKGNPVAEDAPLATGYQLTMTDAGDPGRLTVAVCGDVNGDAAVNMRDVVLMRQTMKKVRTLEGAFQKAAAFKSGSETGPLQEDLAAVKRYLLKFTDRL